MKNTKLVFVSICSCKYE